MRDVEKQYTSSSHVNTTRPTKMDFKNKNKNYLNIIKS